MDRPPLNLSDDEVLLRLSSWIVYESSSNELKGLPVGGHSKRRYSEYLTPGTIKEKSGGFIVADIETLLMYKEDASTIENKKVHIPYAIGFLLVSPGDDLSSLTSNVIETYFSEEYPDFLYTSFEERSSKMMNDFVDRLALVCEKDRQKRKTVYFHNFARFDGILLLKHFLNLEMRVRDRLGNDLPFLMLSLLKQLTSGVPIVRKYPISNEPTFHRPIWFHIIPKNDVHADLEILRNEKSRLFELQFHPLYQNQLESFIQNAPTNYRSVIYEDSPYFIITHMYDIPWTPLVYNQYQPSSMKYKETGGLRNLFNIDSVSRIMPFGIRDAIFYSYCKDMRFSLVLCLMLGFGIWWATAPDLVLFNTTGVLSSPDPGLISRVYEDTFTHKVCSDHTQIVSPCDCGEPLNKELNHMLKEPPFDPLGIQCRLKGAAVGIGVILLSLALAESVSTSGILLSG
ncbi:hypothetical protein CASFOL_043140 [Castilleja foliolosa]|uniref:DNA-directed DNA polymerase n=1 Tax=Castilleja foliolosa TaxID=1961234 RepID=A0ABD3B6M1_9LAMI